MRRKFIRASAIEAGNDNHDELGRFADGDGGGGGKAPESPKSSGGEYHRNEHGAVRQESSGKIAIEYTPTKGALSGTKLTGGTPTKLNGVEMVKFDPVKLNDKLVTPNAQTSDHPGLKELHDKYKSIDTAIRDHADWRPTGYDELAKAHDAAEVAFEKQQRSIANGGVLRSAAREQQILQETRDKFPHAAAFHDAERSRDSASWSDPNRRAANANDAMEIIRNGGSVEEANKKLGIHHENIKAVGVMTMPRKPVTIQGSMTIEAAVADKAPTFAMLAYTGVPMRLKGWNAPVILDYQGLEFTQTLPIEFGGHGTGVIFGQSKSIALDGNNLNVAGTVMGETPTVTDAVKVAKKGFQWQASIVAELTADAEFVGRNQSVKVNGQKHNGPVYVAHEARLRNIAVLMNGADGNTRVSIEAQQEHDMDFAQWLKANGFAEESELSDKAKKTLKAAFDAEQDDDEDETPKPKAKRKVTAGAGAVGNVFSDARRRRENRERILEVAAEILADHPDLVDDMEAAADAAIKAEANAGEFELQALRLARTSPPTNRKDKKIDGPSSGMLEAAAMMAAGLNGNGLVKSYGEQTIETAERAFGTSMRLSELMLACARSNGYTGRQSVTDGNWREVAAFASPQIQASATSSISLPGILGNVANKAMAAVDVDPVWNVPRIFAPVSRNNFYDQTVYSLAVTGDLQEVAPGGELQHLSLGQESYTRTLTTRGALLRLDRRDVINDDLGIFARNAMAIARKSYSTREKIGMSKIMVTGAGSTHFTAAHGNYVTGATSAFGSTGLDAAVKAFRNLTGKDSDPVMVEPSILLVPSTLEGAARRQLNLGSRQLVDQQITANTTSTANRVDSNIYAGRFGGQPLISPLLELATITGYSTAYYYIFADPNVLACYEMAYLNGQQQPTVQYFGMEAAIDSLAMTWRVFWDFAPNAAEWRAGVKVAGA